MIRHMHFWNLAPTEPSKLVVLEILQASFREMVEKIDGLNYVQVDCDMGGGTHDLGMYAEFESWTALQNYKTHPLHLALKARIKDSLTDRSCVDLEVPQ